MQPEDIHKQLRRKIQGYVQDLAEQSVHGQLSPQQLEELERLGRLFKLCQDAQRLNRGWVAGVFIVTLSVISFLLFFPMPSTVMATNLRRDSFMSNRLCRSRCHLARLPQLEAKNDSNPLICQPWC